MTHRFLLFCGILSSVLYAAMNIYSPLQWEEYSVASQTVSELSAIGAPTRATWIWMGAIYTLLVMAFGWGVLASSGANRYLRITGRLILLQGLVSLAWPLAPMHLRGNEMAFTDRMHIALALVTILLMFLEMGFGAAALGKGFRRFTFTCMVAFLIFGGLTGLDSPRLAANLPTPWMGVWERINIGAYLLWITALAVLTLRQKSAAPEPAGMRLRPA